MEQKIALIMIIVMELSITFVVMITNRLSFKAIQNKDNENCLGYNKKLHSFGLELALIGISLIITSFSFFGSDYIIKLYYINNTNSMLISSVIFIFYFLLLIVTVFYKNKYLSVNNKIEGKINFLAKMKKTLQNFFPLVMHNFIGFIMFFVASIILLNQGSNIINLFKNIF